MPEQAYITEGPYAGTMVDYFGSFAEVPDNYNGNCAMPNGAESDFYIGDSGEPTATRLANPTGARITAVDTGRLTRGLNSYQTMESQYLAAMPADYKPTGIAPLIALLIAVIIAIISFTIAATIIAGWLVAAEYKETTEVLTDPNSGKTLYKVCKGHTCAFVDPETGKVVSTMTNDPFNLGNITSTIVLLLLIGGAAYIGFKVILPALSERSKKPWSQQGYMTKVYTKGKELF